MCADHLSITSSACLKSSNSKSICCLLHVCKRFREAQCVGLRGPWRIWTLYLTWLLLSENESCGGLLSTYSSLCDYYAVVPNEQVKWDLENLYQNNRTFNLKKFTSEYEVPLTDKDTTPLFHALAYNMHFTTVVIKHFKFEKGSWNGTERAIQVSLLTLF